MATLPKNPDTLSGEALFILKSLKDNLRLGRTNRHSDVKAILEPSLSLDFDSYFFFLRKFHYLVMERDSLIRLTDFGEQAVEGSGVEKLQSDIVAFFSDPLESTAQTQTFAPPMGAVPDASLGGSEPPPFARPRKTVLIEDNPSTQAFPGRSDYDRPAFVPTAPVQPPPAPVTLKGADLEGRYTKLEPIGSGPLGAVFKGRQNSLGVEVAVKELKDIFGYFSFLQRGEVIKRLKKELCAQAQVRHPAVVAVLDQSTDVARPYFVTELLHESLKTRLEHAAGKGLDFVQSLRWFLQLAYGLKAAHDHGLTHHNIKPENVLLDAFGNAKWSDFGVSRVIEVDASKGMPQVFVGTGGMAYLAPELLVRSKDAGTSADIYGLGIIFYEMLTGQLPGRRSPMPSEVRKEVPAKFDAIFDKMTQDRRESRYTDTDKLLDDVYAALTDSEFLKRGDLILRTENAKQMKGKGA